MSNDIFRQFLLKNVDKKMMINAITCSIMDYTSTSYDDDVNTGDSK